MKSLAWMVGVLCAVSLLSSSTARAASAGGELDGKTFVGDICREGKPTGEKDTLIFKDGRFDSEACHKYGFGDSAYTTTREDGAIKFHAVTMGERGRIVWSGTIKGNEGEGTFVFHRKIKWYNFFLPAKDRKEFKVKLKK